VMAKRSLRTFGKGAITAAAAGAAARVHRGSRYGPHARRATYGARIARGLHHSSDRRQEEP
jgi:hypothetical protein